MSFLLPPGAMGNRDGAGLPLGFDPANDYDANAVHHDISVTSSVKSDVSGIYQVDDLTGNGRHATQVTTSKYCILNSPGQNGLDTMGNDGLDDSLSYPCPDLSVGFMLYIAGRNFQQNNAKYGVGGNLGDRPSLSETGPSLLLVSGGSGHGGTTSVAWSVKTIMGFRDQNGDVRIVLRGEGKTEEIITATPGTNPNAATGIRFFSKHDETSHVGSLCEVWENILLPGQNHSDAKIEQYVDHLEKKWANPWS